MKLILLLFISCSLSRATQAFEIKIYKTNLTEAVAQPLTGQWNPANNTITTSSSSVTNLMAVYCGGVVAIWIPTRTNYLYECKASNDGMQTWLGSTLLIEGTGGPVVLYDVPTRPSRFYRVLETAR